jgi:diketogulonate reductase-like aldo/keto reductase
LAWLLTRPSVASIVVGARTDEQLADNLRAAELTLAESEIARLEEVSRPLLIYPYWHQHASAASRFSPADLALQAPFLDS